MNEYLYQLDIKYIMYFYIMSETKKVLFNSHNKKTKPLTLEEVKKEKDKKRVMSLKWSFSSDNYEYQNQLSMVNNIKNNDYNHNDEVSKIALQEINRKIYGYKQQDIIKKLLDETKFVNFKSIIDKMIDCELKCYYCTTEMNVLYDVSREMKQWSVDRINNDLGHNMDNYYLACLECNLKRRRRSDDKFLFTKQLKIIKSDDVV